MNNIIHNNGYPLRMSSYAVGLLSIIAVTLFSCTGGGLPAAKPRKKLPEFTSFSDFNSSLSFSNQSEHYAGLPFAGSDIEFFANGKFNSYTYIAMGDMASDSLVMNLINTYKPFAIPMLSDWSRNNRKGVLIDFRPKPGPSYSSSEFNVENTGSFSLPVVFIFDGHSASRASWFMGTLKDMPSLKVTSIDANKGILSKSGSYNCF